MSVPARFLTNENRLLALSRGEKRFDPSPEICTRDHPLGTPRLCSDPCKCCECSREDANRVNRSTPESIALRNAAINEIRRKAGGVLSKRALAELAIYLHGKTARARSRALNRAVRARTPR
jgi:hypothetical protein